MRTGLAAVVVAASAIATSPAARADGVYFSEAFGPGVVRDQLSNDIDSATFRIKLAAGVRAGDWALEPFIAAEMTNLDQPAFDQPALTAYGLDLKRIMKVSEHLSVYVRGSMSQIAFPDQAPCCVAQPLLYPPGGGQDLYGYSGRGLGVGVGAQLSGKVSAWGLLAWPLFFLVQSGPKINAGLFIEDSYDYYRLLPSQTTTLQYRPSIDGTISRLTFGFAVGSDF